ncbi:uncharacterized protein LOC135414988 [Pseudopipra pipra]|uniref:uncharacterized protein LOC135414988 n=1 Tax=Pseudopipra pipra TaxID=415032 RepID=UPI003138EF9E
MVQPWTTRWDGIQQPPGTGLSSEDAEQQGLFLTQLYLPERYQLYFASLLTSVLDVNVWTTLANVTKTDVICVSMATPTSPFCTCLVGVPIDNYRWGTLYNETVLANCTHPGTQQPLWWCQASWRAKSGKDATWYIKSLAYMHNFPALPIQPQELDILGTLTATRCFYLNYTSGTKVNEGGVDIFPRDIYRNASAWCNETLQNQFIPGFDAIGLPNDLFLICGQRAWKGIPGKAVGGPCTFGQLTFFHPRSVTLPKLRRRRRGTRRFTPDCNSDVEFWNKAERITASIISQIGTAHALASLNKLGCWLAKEANATSAALSALLTDVDSVRHASLQNRAAIDFLLLAQGHGCQDFEGMCCMNLSDHSESVHASIQKLKALTQQLHVHDEWNLFGDWKWGWPWLRKVLIGLSIVGCIITCILCMIPCILTCVR